VGPDTITLSLNERESQLLRERFKDRLMADMTEGRVDVDAHDVFLTGLDRRPQRGNGSVGFS
jgi:hypothetical protein